MSPHQIAEWVFMNWFCFLEASCFHRKAEAEWLPPSKVRCLNYGYHMFGFCSLIPAMDNHNESHLGWELLETQWSLPQAWQEPQRDEGRTVLLTNPRVPTTPSHGWAPSLCTVLQDFLPLARTHWQLPLGHEKKKKTNKKLTQALEPNHIEGSPPKKLVERLK